jgi:predicted adenylyl cyclase CyaB
VDFTKLLGSSWKQVQPRTLETTSMYDNAEQFMIVSDGRLRIRTGHKSSLSYKRPVTRDGIKVEIEYESEIEDPEQVELILKEIGYEKVSSYARFRTIWQTEKVKIFLDEFSFGNFIEIEGEREDILTVATEMGFDLTKNITRSYDGIYKDICKEKGIVPSPHIK